MSERKWLADIRKKAAERGDSLNSKAEILWMMRAGDVLAYVATLYQYKEDQRDE